LFPDPTNSPEYLGAVVADPAVTSALPIFQWFVQDANAAETQTGTRACVYYDGHFHDNVFVRIRGGSSLSWDKPSLKFDFNRGQYLQFAPGMEPVEELNLNSTWSDKAYVRQALSFEVYKDAGVIGSQAFPVRVEQNGGFYSVAVFVEQVDDHFLDSVGLHEEGALYKSVQNNTVNSATSGIEKKTRLDEDRSDLQALVNGLQLSGAARETYLFDNVDIPSVINYIAATAIIGDNDHPHKNFYLYRDSDGNGEWMFIPWDKDLTFGRNYVPGQGVLNDTIWADHDPQSHPLFGDSDHPKIDGPWNRFIDAMHDTPVIQEMYVRRLRTLMDDILQAPGTLDPALEARIDELGVLLGPDVALDRAAWGNPYGANEGLLTSLEILKDDYLAPRRTHLFETHSVDNGSIIPNAQVGSPSLEFGAFDYAPVSADPDQEYIEIVNPNAFAVDISGWHLTGGVEHTFKPGTVIPAGGSLYVTPDAAAFRARTEGPSGGQGLLVQDGMDGHLDSDGETVRLLDPALDEVASIVVGDAADTQFSVDRGFYDLPFDVAITSATVGAEIRYTTDGAWPSETEGTLYTGPVHIDTTTVLRAVAYAPDRGPSNVDTQTYVFLGDVIQQPNDPAGWPTSWGVAADYEMDPEIVDDPSYGPQMLEALTSIPSMSIVMDMDDFLGPDGIYSNPTSSGLAWERPCSVEYFDADGGDEFQLNCGIRIQGGASRNPSKSPKHSLRLLFKSDYGPTKLEFPLFEDSPVERFDTIVLRARFNLSWIHWDSDQRQKAQLARDQFLRDVQAAMGHPTAHGTYVHLYVNGLYWGLYNPSERPDASFAAEHLGGEKEEWDSVKVDEAEDGDKVAWDTAIAIAGAGVADAAGYAALAEYVDVENLIDYMILNYYGANADWPHHNWYAIRLRAPGEGFKFISWDAENTLRGVNDWTTRTHDNSPEFFHRKLTENPEYRLLFADRLQKHLFNGGVLTPEVAAAMWMERADEIDMAVIGESARWGDYRRDVHVSGTAYLYDRDDFWIPEQQRLLVDYFPVRTGKVLQQFRAAGLFPNLVAPSFSQHGGTIESGFELTVAAPAGA
ncbi:CotH kinase family protein, partial [bacterium]|nr:CotH kinase family protein [bacterium]